jgi:hypothetical protein
MKTVFVVLLGLVLGFFFGEALAAMAGMIGFAAFQQHPLGAGALDPQEPAGRLRDRVRRRSGRRGPLAQAGLAPVSFQEEIT